MKKSFSLLITVICIISTSSVYAQWTTNGSDLSSTNNIIIGNTSPTTTTKLNLTETSNDNLIFTLENKTSLPYPGSTYTGIQFKNGLPFEIYSKAAYGCDPKSFHIKPIGTGTGAGIHFFGSSIAFSDNPVGNLCGNNMAIGKYVFDGGIGTNTGITIGYSSGFPAPTGGYKFINVGTSYFNQLAYFKDKVVIGATNASPTGTHKLYVGGSIICEEIFVKLQANWPDFVFSPQYKLRPLSEVKTFIAENNHLPDVPAAFEVEENGIATGDMLTIQMKKIEELTLYLIQMQEENEALKKRIEALEVK